MQEWKLGDADYAALAHMLRRVEFFAPMSVAELESCLEVMTGCAGRPGETVCRQGAAGDAFYIVFEGQVSVRVKKGFFSPSHTLAFLGRGKFFGEMALLNRAKRAATIVCEAPTKLFVLHSDRFDQVLRHNPALADLVKKTAAKRKAATDSDF